MCVRTETVPREMQMHCLIKATKKTACTDWNHAGGKAEDLYYLIYRLAPWKMTSKGYRWTDVANFPSNTEKWSSAMNMRDHLRRRILRRKYLPRPELSSPKTKPGISPTIFTDFFAGLCRFSGPFGHVILFAGSKGDGCDRSMAREVARDHSILVSRLTAYAKRRESGGFALLSQALQYGLFIRTCRMATKRSVIRLMETF